MTALMGRYGRDSLLREVRDADTSNVDNETARRAQNYLGQYSLEEVRSVSNGAAAFYVWVSTTKQHFLILPMIILLLVCTCFRSAG